MLSIKLIGQEDLSANLSAQLRSEVKRLADTLYTEIRKTTPVDTGRARAGWRKTVSDKEFEISNSVPYIGVLDKGRVMTNRGMRGSKQAPNGIVGPSLQSIKGRN